MSDSLKKYLAEFIGTFVLMVSSVSALAMWARLSPSALPSSS
jgi:glycerol uptake facilitator-like aquaporin